MKYLVSISLLRMYLVSISLLLKLSYDMTCLGVQNKWESGRPGRRRPELPSEVLTFNLRLSGGHPLYFIPPPPSSMRCYFHNYPNYISVLFDKEFILFSNE